MSSFKGKLKDFVFSTLPGWDAPCQSTRLLVFSDNSFRNKQGIDFIYKNRRVDRLVVFLSLPDLRDVFQSNFSFLNHHLFIEQIFSQCFPFFFSTSVALKLGPGMCIFTKPQMWLWCAARMKFNFTGLSKSLVSNFF